jgi:hypothetical protein
MVTREGRKRIMLDIGNKTPPEKSDLKYGPIDLAERKRLETSFKEIAKKNPDVQLDLPFDP